MLKIGLLLLGIFSLFQADERVNKCTVELKANNFVPQITRLMQYGRSGDLCGL